VKPNLGVLFWPLACLLTAGTDPVRSQPFSLSVHAVQERLQHGSQVEIKLTLSNTSRGEITIRDTNSWCDDVLDVRNSQGELKPETDYKRNLKCNSKITVTLGRRIIRILKPGESFDDAMFVNQSCDMSRPGDYRIKAVRKIPKELGDGNVESNTVTITVTE
jgi:hypothetical protein